MLESLRSESEDGDGESLQETLAPVIKAEKNWPCWRSVKQFTCLFDCRILLKRICVFRRATSENFLLNLGCDSLIFIFFLNMKFLTWLKKIKKNGIINFRVKSGSCHRGMGTLHRPSCDLISSSNLVHWWVFESLSDGGAEIPTVCFANKDSQQLGEMKFIGFFVFSLFYTQTIENCHAASWVANS